jgi:hypothetical protein
MGSSDGALASFDLCGDAKWGLVVLALSSFQVFSSIHSHQSLYYTHYTHPLSRLSHYAYSIGPDASTFVHDPNASLIISLATEKRRAG